LLDTHLFLKTIMHSSTADGNASTNDVLMQSLDEAPAIPQRQRRRRLANWSDDGVLELISAYKAAEAAPAENGENTDVFFSRVHAAMSYGSNPERSIKALKEKWSALAVMYRQVFSRFQAASTHSLGTGTFAPGIQGVFRAPPAGAAGGSRPG
jgi:hypothetical protein